jgi:pimeloyl-ACP methyl ester carboxylesterase
VDLPALVLVGSRDLLTPVPAAKRIVKHLRKGELHVFPGAGHQLMQERPREVAELILGLAERLDHAAADTPATAAAGAPTAP